jgi:hypothetical protein
MHHLQGHAVCLFPQRKICCLANFISGRLDKEKINNEFSALSIQPKPKVINNTIYPCKQINLNPLLVFVQQSLSGIQTLPKVVYYILLVLLTQPKKKKKKKKI